MAEVKVSRSKTLALMLVVLTFLSLAAGCELQEPKSPIFATKTPLASPTPVYPSAPIDSGINDKPCEVLAEGLSSAVKSNLRYGAEVTFRRGLSELVAARNLMGDLSDTELSESLDLLLASIGRDDAGGADAAADSAVRRCKELGYRAYMAPFGFKVW